MTQLSLKIKMRNGAIIAYSVYALIGMAHSWLRVENLDFDTIALILVTTVLFWCTFVASVLPIQFRISQTEVAQYRELVNHGVAVNGRITFSGSNTPLFSGFVIPQSGGAFLTSGEIQYMLRENETIKEIRKESTTTRDYETKRGDVESVKLLAVLPGHPYSGVEATHAESQIVRLERQLPRYKWALLVHVVVGIALWPWAIRRAMEDDFLHEHPYFAMSNTSLMVLVVLYSMVILALKPRLTWNKSLVVGVIGLAAFLFVHLLIMELVLKRLNDGRVSTRAFAPVIIYVAVLLFIIVKYLRPGQKTIIDPLCGVTVSSVKEKQEACDTGIESSFCSHEASLSKPASL